MSAREHFLIRRDRWKDLVAAQDLSSRALRLALVLASRFNEREDENAFIAIDTAAEIMAVSRSTAKRAAKELVAANLLAVTVRKGHSTNLFAMAFGPVGAADRQANMVNRLSQQRQSTMLDRLPAQETGQIQGVLAEETGHHADPLSVKHQLEAGPPLQGGPHHVELTSDGGRILLRDVALFDAAPDAPLMGAGAHADGEGLEVVFAPTPNTPLPASAGAERVADLDRRLDAYRDPETGTYPKFPPSVGVFNDRELYGDEDDICSSESLAEIERDLASWEEGTWHAGGDDEEEGQDEVRDLSHDARILTLHRAIESVIRDRVSMPAVFADFVDRAVDPEADELDDLEASWFEFAEAAEAKARRRDRTKPAPPLEGRESLTEREEVERLIVERSRAQKEVEPPLAVRMEDAERRASYVQRMSRHLHALDREARWHETKAQRAKIFAGLTETLPRFRASAIAEALFVEVLTEVWRQDRGPLSSLATQPPILAPLTRSSTHG